MNDKKLGELWWFNLDGKVRPVVIVDEGVSGTEVDVIFAKVTSHAPRNKYDVEIIHWREANLKVESLVRCSKLFTVESMGLKRRIGMLHNEDLLNVLSKIAEKINENVIKAQKRIEAEANREKDS